MKFRFFFLFFALLSGSEIAAQSNTFRQDSLFRTSPQGVYILFSDEGASARKPYQGLTAFVISRAEAGSSRFREIARVERPASLEAFRALAGADLADKIRELKKLPSNDALWQYLEAHPSLNDYGLLALDLRLGQALGAYYLDESVKNAKAGSRFHYQVRGLRPDGSTTAPLEGEVSTGLTIRADRPRLHHYRESDSTLAMAWVSAPQPEITFARVYRQTGGRGAFELLRDRCLAVRQGDSLLFAWQENVQPEVLYRYCIQPTDLYGNPGLLSDTVALVSIHPRNVPLLENVVARDSLNSILLSWKALPPKTYWTGILVERSRDVQGAYVVLDTLPATDTRYLDQRSLPNTVYYYRLKAITIRSGSEPTSAAVSGTWRNQTLAPTPPTGLRGKAEGRGVRLNWEGITEPDLFAYYVYRGRSLQDSLVVVSSALQATTFLDTSRTLSGRTDYVYAVRAINRSELISDFSNKVLVRPLIPAAPPAPLGISGYPEGTRIRLTWHDASLQEETVIGYQLYRRKAPASSAKEPANFGGLPGSQAASRYGFQLIANAPAPFFDDTTVPAGTYQYAVTAIDIQGAESVLSPVTTIGLTTANLLPPAEINARSTSRGIELDWGSSLQTEVRGYAVYRRSRTENTPRRIGTLNGEQSSYLDASPQNGTLYFYSVSSLSANGESVRSAEKGVRREY